MRTRMIGALMAAAMAGALAVAVGPAAAHAAADDRTPLPKSQVQSAKSLAAAAVTIKNRKSNKYLQPSSTANGATVRQQNFSTSATQGWILVNDSGYFTFWNNGVNRNMGTSGTSTASNTSAVIVNPSGSTDQDWLVSWIDSTYFHLKNRKNTAMCLGIDGGSTAAGARAAIYGCDNSINQTWSFTTF